MNISFRQIRSFLLVARLGNFTRAAEHIHITQAGLSIMMRELENQLGCRLFDRTTRVVTLTEAGEQFLPVAKRLVSELEQSIEQFDSLAANARQHLRLGVTPLISSTVLPAALKLFRDSHPEVTPQVVDTDPQQVQAMVMSGEIDFGLGAFFQPTAGLKLTALFDYQLMWTWSGAVGTPVAVNTAVAPATVAWSVLADAGLIGLPPENKIQQLIERHLAAIGRAHEDRPAFNNFETLLAMVSAGMGTAIVPTYGIAACRRHGLHSAVLISPDATLSFYCITKRGREMAAAMPAFIDALKAAVPGRK